MSIKILSIQNLSAAQHNTIGYFHLPTQQKRNTPSSTIQGTSKTSNVVGKVVAQLSITKKS
jgi:hypothetical protein